jgi:F0F1-type ATP synthase, subunit c/Archaeal/vacuolar-type H+-ATPase, subunit K
MKLVKKLSVLLMALLIITSVCGFTKAATIKKAEKSAVVVADEDTPQLISTQEEADTSSTTGKALGAAIAVGLAAAAGAIAMGMAVAKSSEAIARQPEASGEIRGSLLLGLILIETVVIYALIVAILIIFVM